MASIGPCQLLFSLSFDRGTESGRFGAILKTMKLFHPHVYFHYLFVQAALSYGQDVAVCKVSSRRG